MAASANIFCKDAFQEKQLVVFLRKKKKSEGQHIKSFYMIPHSRGTGGGPRKGGGECGRGDGPHAGLRIKLGRCPQMVSTVGHWGPPSWRLTVTTPRKGTWYPLSAEAARDTSLQVCKPTITALESQSSRIKNSNEKGQNSRTWGLRTVDSPAP